ncbi:MAG: hypothetical protein R3C05_05140 [Pirellulaceae bacterium]
MFDPLHQWFGIPPSEQPPSHYRLLGVADFETNADVIDTAYEKQMTYLHGCANGEHAELAEALMNEISAARLCLLNPKRKAAYDASLEAARDKALPSSPPTQAESSSSALRPNRDHSNRSEPRQPAKNPFTKVKSASPRTPSASVDFNIALRQDKRRRSRSWFLAMSFLATILVFTLALLILKLKEDVEPVSADAPLIAAATENETAEPADPSAPTPDSIPTPDSTNESTSATQDDMAEVDAVASSNETPSSSSPDNESMNNPVSANDSPAANPSADGKPTEMKPDVSTSTTTSTGGANPFAAPNLEGLAAAETSSRLALPDDQGVAEARKLVLEVYADQNAAAKTKFDKTKLAKKIYQTGLDTKDDDTVRYVLWRYFALPMLVKNEEFETAFEVIDSLGQHYRYDGLVEKTKVLKGIPQATFVRSPESFDLFEAVIDEAINEGDFDVAKAVTSHWLGLVSASRRKPIEAMLAKIEELKKLHSVYTQAVEQFKTKPDDPEANLQIGRYLCFGKDQWPVGLDYLAVGSDSQIAEAAKQEKEYQAAFAKTVEQEMALGDAWFEIAANEPIQTYQNAIGQHAVEYYRTAVQSMPSGVNKLKAEKRIEELSQSEEEEAGATSKNVLGYRRFDSKESAFDSYRRNGNEFTVSMGKADDGKGEAGVGVELRNVTNLKVGVFILRGIRRIDDASKVGFFVDYGTPNGYSKRVFHALPPHSVLADFNSNPPWGASGPPAETNSLKMQRVYDIPLQQNAPLDWDGRCWFSLYMQNTGYGSTARVRVQF